MLRIPCARNLSCTGLKKSRKVSQVFDLVARLLVFGDHLFEGDILLFGEALLPPHLRGRGRSVGDMGPRQGPCRTKGEGAAKHGPPRKNGHSRPLPCSQLHSHRGQILLKVSHRTIGWAVRREQILPLATVETRWNDRFQTCAIGYLREDRMMGGPGEVSTRHDHDFPRDPIFMLPMQF
jgi:hypothetical protein